MFNHPDYQVEYTKFVKDNTSQPDETLFVTPPLSSASSLSSDNTEEGFHDSGALIFNKTIRVRTTFTDFQKDTLESEFQKSPYLYKTRRIEIADRLQLNEKHVKVWFQNRRMKSKKEIMSNGNKVTKLYRPNYIQPVISIEPADPVCEPIEETIPDILPLPVHTPLTARLVKGNAHVPKSFTPHLIVKVPATLGSIPQSNPQQVHSQTVTQNLPQLEVKVNPTLRPVPQKESQPNHKQSAQLIWPQQLVKVAAPLGHVSQKNPQLIPIQSVQQIVPQQSVKVSATHGTIPQNMIPMIHNQSGQQTAPLQQSVKVPVTLGPILKNKPQLIHNHSLQQILPQQSVKVTETIGSLPQSKPQKMANLSVQTIMPLQANRIPLQSHQKMTIHQQPQISRTITVRAMDQSKSQTIPTQIQQQKRSTQQPLIQQAPKKQNYTVVTVTNKPQLKHVQPQKQTHAQPAVVIRPVHQSKPQQRQEGPHQIQPRLIQKQPLQIKPQLQHLKKIIFTKQPQAQINQRQRPQPLIQQQPQPQSLNTTSISETGSSTISHQPDAQNSILEILNHSPSTENPIEFKITVDMSKVVTNEPEDSINLDEYLNGLTRLVEDIQKKEQEVPNEVQNSPTPRNDEFDFDYFLNNLEKFVVPSVENTSIAELTEDPKQDIDTNIDMPMDIPTDMEMFLQSKMDTMETQVVPPITRSEMGLDGFDMEDFMENLENYPSYPGITDDIEFSPPANEFDDNIENYFPQMDLNSIIPTLNLCVSMGNLSFEEFNDSKFLLKDESFLNLSF